MKTATQTLSRLQFRQIRQADYADIARYMMLSDSLTCDYTLGGIVLWADFFDYRFAIRDNTFYLCGGREDNLSVRAFAIPVGDSGFDGSLQLLRESFRGPIWFSAVPEDRLHLFASEPSARVAELGSEWSDYLYDIHGLASLEGGALKRKRNHVNRFLVDHSDARLVDLDEGLCRGCREVLELSGCDGTPTGVAEYEAVSRILTRWADFAPYFCGSVLLVGDRPVGFTVGETKGAALHVHIEKCNHEVSGANEALTSMFAAEMLRRNQGLLYVNRQDDAGDPGLRASKESWRPLRLLPKFNVCVA